jgi:pimeloyl-ACP methyl ester carboxylesterase
VPVGEWLVAAARPAPTNRRPSAPSQVETPALEGAGFIDRAEMIATSQGTMLAISCLPTTPTRHGRDWVVFLNTGRIRRVGTNRLSTIWARKWAQAGTPSLRLDVRGVGDSEGFAVGDEAHFNEPRIAFRPSVMVDLSAAFAWLAEHHQAERFTLVGLSSGATLAYQLALRDPRVTGIAMINPPALFWDDRLQLLSAWDDARKAGAGPRALYRAARGHGLRWTKKALQGGLLSLRGETPTKWDRRPALDSLTRFRADGRQVGAVFTSNDRGLRYFERTLGADYLDQFERLGVLVEIVSGPDHTFRPLWSHTPLTAFLERLLEHAGYLDRPQDAEAGAPARP